MKSNIAPTRNGHDMFVMASLLQKAIRRGEHELAAYAAHELAIKHWRSYLWKRLLTISAEDCYGIMTQEIEALHNSDVFVNANRTEDKKSNIFIAKAVTLLLMALKNRDADYLSVNHMRFKEIMTDEQVVDLVGAELTAIPEYVYDVHTLRGKKRGKTKMDMLVEEQEAMTNKQLNLFEPYDWKNFEKNSKR